MKQTSTARGAIMAALAMAASSGFVAEYTPPSRTYKSTIPTKPKRKFVNSDAAIAKWNAEVDARKAAKKAAKIGENV